MDLVVPPPLPKKIHQNMEKYETKVTGIISSSANMQSG